jgi:hypothetical protein
MYLDFHVVDAVAVDGRELIGVNRYTPIISDKDGSVIPDTLYGLDHIPTSVDLENLDVSMLLLMTISVSPANSTTKAMPRANIMI